MCVYGVRVLVCLHTDTQTHTLFCAVRHITFLAFALRMILRRDRRLVSLALTTFFGDGFEVRRDHCDCSW